VFSVLSVQRSYKRYNLGAKVGHSVKRRVDGWCELAASLAVSWSNESLWRQSPASKGMNTEVEVFTALEAVTRQRLVKPQ
jgi:hypothetical protein